jgi:hypothetical protein
MSIAIAFPPPPFSQVFSQPNALNFQVAKACQILEQELKETEQWINELFTLYDILCQSAEVEIDTDRVSQTAKDFWDHTCSSLALCQKWLIRAKQLPTALNITIHSSRNKFIAGRKHSIETLADLIRTMYVVWDDLDLIVPEEIADSVWTIRISPLAYARAIWNLFWSCLLHPFSETTIELKTGRTLITD